MRIVNRFLSGIPEHMEIHSRRRKGAASLHRTITIYRDEIILNIATLCFFLTIHSVAPYISQYAVEIGATEAAVALLGPFFAFSAMTLRPVSGILSDRGWTKKLLVTGAAVSASAQIVFLASSGPELLYVGRFIQGAAVAIFIPASFQAAAVGGRDAVISSLAWRSTITGLSFAVGPAVGGYVAQHLGYRALFLFSAVLALAASMLSLLIDSARFSPARSPVDPGDSSSGLVNRGFAAALASLLLFSSAYASMLLFLPAYYKEVGLGASSTAIFFTGAAISNLASRLTFTRILSAIGVENTAILGMLLLSIGYVFVAIDPLSSSTLYYGIIAGAGMGMTLPSLQVIAIADIPQGRRGIASAIYTTMFDLGNLTGPLGVAAVARTYRDMISVSSLVSLAALAPIAFLQIFRLLKRNNRDQDQ